VFGFSLTGVTVRLPSPDVRFRGPVMSLLVGMRTLASCAAAFAAALLLTAVPAPAAAQFAADSSWAATWQASPEPARAPAVTLQQQTVRQVVRVSLGGGRFRVRLSNDFGDKPVNIGAAHIALAGVGS